MQALYTCILVLTVSLLLFNTHFVSLDSVVAALPMHIVQLCFQGEVSDGGPEIREFMDDLQHIVSVINCGRIINILSHHVCLLQADCKAKVLASPRETIHETLKDFLGVA